MIKEILEQNGIDVSWEFFNNLSTRYTLYLYKIDKKEYIFATDINQKLLYKEIERACRQYVKENGFKLEWFEESLYQFKNEIVNGYIMYFTDEEYVEVREHKIVVRNGLIETFGSLFHFEQPKLIAWLYANDIEIKE